MRLFCNNLKGAAVTQSCKRGLFCSNEPAPPPESQIYQVSQDMRNCGILLVYQSAYDKIFQNDPFLLNI